MIRICFEGNSEDTAECGRENISKISWDIFKGVNIQLIYTHTHTKISGNLGRRTEYFCQTYSKFLLVLMRDKQRVKKTISVNK